MRWTEGAIVGYFYQKEVDYSSPDWMVDHKLVLPPTHLSEHLVSLLLLPTSFFHEPGVFERQPEFGEQKRRAGALVGHSLRLFGGVAVDEQRTERRLDLRGFG